MNRTLSIVLGSGLVGALGIAVGVLLDKTLAGNAVDCSQQGYHCVKVRVDADNTTDPPTLTVKVDSQTINNKVGQSQVIHWFIEQNQNQGFDFGPAPNPPTSTTVIAFTNAPVGEFRCKQLDNLRLRCDDQNASASPAGGFKYNLTVINSAGVTKATTDPFIINN